MAPRTVGRRSITLPLRESAEGSPVRPSPSGPSHTQHTDPSVNIPAKSLLLIGIDYGTTFTSIAYIYIKNGTSVNSGSLGVRLSSIECITSWPGATETGFVPTITLYESKEPGPSDPKWWGYKVAKALDRGEAPPSAYEIRLAKLLLHQAKETEEETSPLKKIASDTGKEEIEFIGDFLRRLREFLFGDRGYFKTHHSSWLEDVEIEFVLGMPAAWSEPEQQKMIEVAIEASIDNPSRGSEPEAMAAIYFAQHETSLKIGDTFVICDAGGGTVDLITYTVAELNPLRVNEASVAEGVLCGSTYLNQRLRNSLKKRLENEDYLRNLDKILDQATLRFDLDFKRSFDGTEGEFFSVPGLKEGLKPGFKEDRLWLSRAEVFDPIVDQIKDTIARQIKSSRKIAKSEYDKSLAKDKGDYKPLKIKNIVLGGGFASNPYLTSVLRQKFSENVQVPPELRIDIQQLNSAATTVARGLVLMASRYGLVKQRRSKLSYGIFTYEQYDPEKHGSEDICAPVKDQYERRKDDPKLIKVVDWLVRKGQPLENEASFTRSRDKNIGHSHTGLEEIIYVSEHDTSTEEYTLVSDLPADCKKYRIDTLFLDLNKDENFEKTGKNFYTVYWDVSLTIEDNDMVWSVILKLETGENRISTHPTISLDAEESQTKILGSLASRWAKGPVKPTSKFPQEPIFSRKRPRTTADAGNPTRKSSRLAARSSDVAIPSIERGNENGWDDQEREESDPPRVPQSRTCSEALQDGARSGFEQFSLNGEIWEF